MFIRSSKEIALIVINERKKKGLSQTQFGAIVGLKQKTISSFENKPENIQLETFFRILAAVNMDMHLLLKNQKDNFDEKWNEEW